MTNLILLTVVSFSVIILILTVLGRPSRITVLQILAYPLYYTIFFSFFQKAFHSKKVLSSEVDERASRRLFLGGKDPKDGNLPVYFQ